ncbi:MAG TPA: site-specific DNA-methyltransferase [Bacteroidetes bacterium]|nr:site-specific DNA-methyltransferase [Bacteroidota bacterium]
MTDTTEHSQHDLFGQDSGAKVELPRLIRDSPEISSFNNEDIENSIIHGDSLDVLPKMAENSVDMVFIDPPYFLQLPNKELKRWKVKTSVDAVDDKWDKFASFEEYDSFMIELLTKVQRVMKPTATIWLISTYHSLFRIGKIMQDLGYWILNDVIWVKTNPMPNWLGVRFTNATETLIWAVKDKSAKKYTFNKDHAKTFGIGKVRANVWVLPICTGRERVKDSNGDKLHSTQKPIELLKRIILTSTSENDLILDPVAGTGTTGYVADALNRRFAVIERNEGYIDGMFERFRQKSVIINGQSVEVDASFQSISP